MHEQKHIKRITIFFVLILGTIGTYWAIQPRRISQEKIRISNLEEIKNKATIGHADDPFARTTFQFKKYRDPKINMLPKNISAKEIKYSKKLEERMSRMRNADVYPVFQKRGPVNVGGRTRALAIDVANDQVVLAGGVSGGMWKSEDQGASWFRTTRRDQFPGVTCIAQDIRNNHTNIWYYGTGEIFGNSATKPGATYRGDGIYKSVDNGSSWEVIQSTSTGIHTEFDSPFKYVNNIASDPSNEREDEVYAAVPGGIVRSVNGFTDWQFVLGGPEKNKTDARWTDVAVSNFGMVYASISNIGEISNEKRETGLYKSSDGLIWTEITPATGYQGTYYRTVIGIAPSNEDLVYFLGTNAAGQTSIYLYDNSSGQWSDRSEFTPDFGSPAGHFDAQSSYNLLIKVHPLNHNIVFIGGTNLYRSTNGFASNSKTDWIGGYDNSNTGYGLYPNHHPDQHALDFLSEDPNVMISGHDGGLSLTSNNLAKDVSWETLNNGYFTTQFYTLAIEEQDPGNYSLVGGLQDNSCYYSFNNDPSSEWQDIYGGDGAYTAITYKSIIVSSQFARMYIYTFDEQTGRQTQQGFIRPPGQAENGPSLYSFINPFSVDPNDPERVYVASRGQVYMTYKVTDLPNDKDWVKLSVTANLPENEFVSALGVSTNESHRVYVGTDLGRLFVHANSSDRNLPYQELTSPLFPEGGYLNCIHVNETNSQEVFAVFTNYGVVSIFRSEDAGVSWEAVSGNLEENMDGSGSGPAVNWLETIETGNQTLYLAATSTGLYGTYEINGMATSWAPVSSETLGNVMVDMIKARNSDGYIALGTHGNGTYDAILEKALSADITKTGSQMLCEGDSTILRAVRSNELSYQWFEGNTPIEGETSYKLTVKNEGNYHVQLTNDDGTVYSDTLAFEYSRRPVGTVQTSGENAYEIITECADCHYVWLDNKSRDTLSTEKSFSNADGRNVTARAVVYNKCFTELIDIVEFTVLGTDDLDKQYFSVYPNPVTGDYLNLSGPQAAMVSQVRIIDLNGKEVSSIRSPEPLPQVDVKQLEPGIYFLEIHTANEVVRKKFIRKL